MNVAMISIETRSDVRQRTLRQFWDFGLYPVVFFSEQPPGIINHSENSTNALNFLLRNKGGLFVEDDIDLSKDFLEIMACIELSGISPVALYVPGQSFLPASVKRGEKGIKKLVNTKRFFGSQAVYLLPNVIDFILRNWEVGKFFDTQLQKMDIYGYFPNPVQHFGASLKSTWSPYGKSHTSVTYE